MKAVVACCIAGVLCLIVSIRSVFSQEGNLFCYGFFDMCNVGSCVTGTGTCPDFPDESYAAYDLILNKKITGCFDGPGYCHYTEQITACIYTYWRMKHYDGTCTDDCGFFNQGATVCPIDE
jgi:hypothetical protein